MGISTPWVRLSILTACLIGSGCVSTPGALVFISNADGDQDLYTYSAGQLTQLTSNDYDDLQASWSPDGRQIVYTANIRGNPEIVVYDFATGVSNRLTNSPDLDGSPAFSPDGKAIAFISGRDGRHGIYRMQSDGSDVVLLSPGWSGASAVAWLPGSQGLVAVLQRGPDQVLLQMRPDGSEGRELATISKSSLASLSVSPDGRSLLYSATVNRNSDVYQLHLTSGKTTALTTHRSIDAEPQWSPDGARILWLSARDDNERRELYVMNADGTGKQRLTHAGAEIMNAHWSPDGSQIAFVAHHDRRFVLNLLDLARNERQQLGDHVLGGYQFQPIFNPIGGRVQLTARHASALSTPTSMQDEPQWAYQHSEEHDASE